MASIINVGSISYNTDNITGGVVYHGYRIPIASKVAVSSISYNTDNITSGLVYHGYRIPVPTKIAGVSFSYSDIVYCYNRVIQNQ